MNKRHWSRKYRWLALALILAAVLFWLYRVATAPNLAEYYRTTLLDKTREDIAEIVGAPADWYRKRADVAWMTKFDPAIDAIGHWYTWKGTISVSFDKSGKAFNVQFDPQMRRIGSWWDQFFYWIGW